MLKKLASLLFAGMFVFTAANVTEASLQKFDSPPFDKYLVSEGDTLYYIGKRYGVSLDDLYRFNPDVEGDFLLAGSTLNLVGDQGSNSATVSNSSRVELNAADRDLLERLVHAETMGQEYNGKVAVAEVVLNRVDSSDFPDTVREVIMQNRQFTPVSTGAINNNPSAKTAEAVDEALRGTNLVEDALFFWNPDIATSRWLEEKTVITKIDEHEFLQ